MPNSPTSESSGTRTVPSYNPTPPHPPTHESNPIHNTQIFSRTNQLPPNRSHQLFLSSFAYTSDGCMCPPSLPLALAVSCLCRLSPSQDLRSSQQRLDLQTTTRFPAATRFLSADRQRKLLDVARSANNVHEAFSLLNTPASPSGVALLLLLAGLDSRRHGKEIHGQRSSHETNTITHSSSQVSQSVGQHATRLAKQPRSNS